MIGMGFLSFLTLLAIGFVSAAIIHYGARYRFLRGADGFIAKWIIAWLGAWVASPVLGYWFAGVSVGQQYVIPAFIGAFSAAFMTTAVCAAAARIARGEITDAPGYRVTVTEEHRAA
jgi:uncharacterized membrane protein YeaQ/YmgE (transglycosylase-associated protein family)